MLLWHSHYFWSLDDYLQKWSKKEKDEWIRNKSKLQREQEKKIRVRVHCKIDLVTIVQLYFFYRELKALKKETKKEAEIPKKDDLWFGDDIEEEVLKNVYGNKTKKTISKEILVEKMNTADSK